MNLPNVLTIFRIAASPALMILLLVEGASARLAALILFVLAGLSDLLDGIIARSTDQVTGFGRFMDPIADKLLISMALISLVALRVVPAWMVLVIIGREFLIMGLRTLVAYRGEVMESSGMAKAKTFLQALAVSVILLALVLDDLSVKDMIFSPYLSLQTVGQWLLLLAMAMTVLSGLDYIYKSRWLILNLFRDNF